MNKLISITAFFIYSGFYAGLAIIFALNQVGLSRFYSIPIRIFLSVIMLYIILKKYNNLINNNKSRYLFLFIFFWIFYILKVLYTENSALGSGLSKAWPEYVFFAVTYVVFPFFTLFTINFEKHRIRILDGIIFSGFTLGAFSTYLYGSLLAKGVGRISLITYETGNDVLSPLVLSYSGTLTIVLCMHKLIILKEKRKKHVLYLYTTIGLSFVMFLLGSSRGSVIALALTLPLFILYSPLKQKVRLTILAVLSGPLVVWLIDASGSSIFDRIGNTVEDKGSGRNYLWKNAYEHFLEHPIFGGNIEIGGIYPHNFFLEILMSSGLVGAFLLFPIFFHGVKESIYWTRKNKENLFILLIFIQGVALHSFTAGFYTATLLFVPIAMAFSLSQKK